MTPMTVLISILLTLLGLVVGYYVRKTIAEAKIAGARGAAEQILEDAKRDAEALKKEALLEAKDEIHTLRIDAEQEVRERRNELQKQENRLLQKEENLDRKHEGIDKREAMLEKKDHSLNERQQHIEEMESKVDEMIRMQQSELERISSLTRDEAKQIILDRVENELSHDIAIMTKETENRAKEEADKKAKNILSLALQRCAADHVAETTVSVVNLPNDEMKGRIIGREGRNIRTLETLTGIDLIIDDTPEAVILSGFDPIRRETARIALDKLVQDGRIHPARIEEMVEKSRREVDDYIREMGEQTTFEVGVHGLHPDLIKILGRLKFRTSYGQNVLKHSMEVAFLAGLMASELGEDAKLAKRAGLLHDIGKAIDHEVEGSHVEIGVELATKYKEHPVVINSIASHHGDEEPTSIIAVLVAAADALSAARPGARSETLENYIRRLEKLEEISESYEGVEKSFAIQAGREVRIMVKPDSINDLEAHRLARDIRKRIEDELDYPGHIKVTVIRETRAVEYAK
ncbi:ribonuclease Y [Bacillus sp. L381]|jgi:ribonuclease Y|uniref:Ribonuclease Y n=5 Tax=Bacillus amyloliquefaciens group TaxID=1938374 RepID=RNY_BACVZ|nr:MULTISPECIES: ribonuclease Y [Bacillus]A7Z4W7.1 RecName: Full=Ribonuclease Y; Short=RNase Y [Bacillus velezensis FZB42]AIU77111.1 ribonuclease [Bacillus subtilis]ARM27876.1 ribonuclease Y [Bacillus vallismortis]UXZ19524.1 ribonuclease Y [Bacillus siamensis]COC48348.1 Hydrolase HAD superfamily [Streptococcus pneumoniae]SLB20425.1 Ribonuclease Y [Mycobacteroides abscessus subsp. massiliense]|eukprot:TRINITY_DN19648_c0_g1_i1.p1 TRINITY_DN19648_c0_g1~~TRINITY_DN19648_c0_g1_i1.p1  ORF type:complete len:520 (+),score=-32.85 TRINITY_DN19648_c0_g1_i1:167-1726(+)